MISLRRSLFEVSSLFQPVPSPPHPCNPPSLCFLVIFPLTLDHPPFPGARAYYLHGVLHDWPDASALQILENQKSAMRPGYSLLLIHEHVIGQALDHPHATAYDLTMIGMVAGRERTEEEWRDLVAGAGMRLERVWRSEGAVQAILEVAVGGVVGGV